MNASTITVRGEDFPDAEAVADRFKVSLRWVRRAVRQGKADCIGIGKSRDQGNPTEVRGEWHPSQKAAAEANRVSPQTMCAALMAGRADGVGLGRPWALKALRAGA